MAQEDHYYICEKWTKTDRFGRPITKTQTNILLAIFLYKQKILLKVWWRENIDISIHSKYIEAFHHHSCINLETITNY